MNLNCWMNRLAHHGTVVMAILISLHGSVVMKCRIRNI